MRAYAANLPALNAVDALLFVARSRIADAGQMKLATARQEERRLRRMLDSGERRPADLGRLRSAGIVVEFRNA